MKKVKQKKKKRKRWSTRQKKKNGSCRGGRERKKNKTRKEVRRKIKKRGAGREKGEGGHVQVRKQKKQFQPPETGFVRASHHLKRNTNLPTHVITTTVSIQKRRKKTDPCQEEKKNTNKGLPLTIKHHNGHPWFLPYLLFPGHFFVLLLKFIPHSDPPRSEEIINSPKIELNCQTNKTSVRAHTHASVKSCPLLQPLF